MKANSKHIVAEEHQSLWLLIFSPSIWAAHFLLSYIGGVVWCGKVAGREGNIEPIRVGIMGLGALALIGIGLIGRLGWLRYTHGGTEAGHHQDTAEDRHRFLGFAAVLLSGLSAVATIYVALSSVFVKSCQ